MHRQPFMEHVRRWCYFGDDEKGKKGDKLRISYNGMVTATPANILPAGRYERFASTMAEASYRDFVESDGNGGSHYTTLRQRANLE